MLQLNQVWSHLDRALAERRFRLARIWSNDELRTVAAGLEGSVVNVSGWRDEDKEGSRYRDYFSKASEYRITNHQESFRGFQGEEGELAVDLEAPLPDDLRERFDVVFNHTVLEHVYDVHQAVKNLCDMSRDLVVLVVPFSQMQHDGDTYGDFWRFTPSGVRRLLEASGLTLLRLTANDDPNAAIYLFAVASKHPERWGDRFSSPTQVAGNVIGKSRFRAYANRLRRAVTVPTWTP